MRTSTSVLSSVLPALLAGMLAGCSAAGSQGGLNPHAYAAAVAQPLAVSEHVYAYISDPSANFVDAFDRRGNLIAKITDGVSAPEGLYVDAAHNLWVANADGTIAVFPPGSTSPSRTLDDAGGVPGDVVVGPDATAYVANISDASGYGSIEVYPPGQNEPARTLRDPNASQNYFITIDETGNLFVTVFERVVKGGLGGRVDEYVGAQQSGLKRLFPKMGAPGGIRVHAGKLLICDTTRHTVKEYAESGRPTGRVFVTGGAWGGFDVNPAGTKLLGADQSYLDGVERNFPGETVRRVFRDASFQYPVGAAYASGQKDS